MALALVVALVVVALRASVQDLGVGLVEHRKWLLHVG